MAMGLPIIASDAGGNTELVADEKGGFVCAVGDISGFADRLIRLTEDSDAARGMAQYNRERIEREFTDEIMVDHHLRLYNEIVRNCGRSAA
jgi:glycosyltransferase involved in cell wall biosynthesis